MNHIQQVLAFKVSNQRLAFKFEDIVEVCALPDIVPTNSHPSFSGVFNLRGTVYKVAKWHSRLEKEASSPTSIILVNKTSPVAFLVDDLIGVEKYSKENIHSLENEMDFYEAIGKSQDGLTFILKLPVL